MTNGAFSLVLGLLSYPTSFGCAIVSSRRLPTRWLVADDVGLGKTIEAGLMLWPLLSKGLVKRLLILCPASLVVQWQAHLRDMFDIRLAQYVPQADTAKSDFWGTHHQVVASLQTLRADHDGRHVRILDADPWESSGG